MYTPPFFEEETEPKSPSLLYSGGDLAMINQNYLFHIFLTKNRFSNNKNIEFEI